MTSAFIGIGLLGIGIGLWLAWALRRSGFALPAATAVGVPALAIAVYVALGAPALRDLPMAERTEPAVQQVRDLNEYRKLTGRLADQLRDEPDNLEGWTMLTGAYRNLAEWSFAIEAWRRVLALKGDAATGQDWADMAVLIVRQAEGEVTPVALQMSDRALAADPKQPEARHLQALAKAQAGDLAAAIKAWEVMLAEAPADADWRVAIASYLAQARARLTAPARGPSQADMAAAAQMSAEDRAAMIEGMVDSLAAHLAEQPDDPEGWLRLARAYSVLGRAEDAGGALDRAVESAEARLAADQGNSAAMQAVLAQAAAIRAALPQ